MKCVKHLTNYSDYLEEAIVFILFLILTLYLVWQRQYPYLYDDEYGVLGAAAAISGHSWRAPENMPFYGFLLSIFVSPFYKLALDPVTLYRTALSLNAVLVAMSAALAVRLLRLFLLPISRIFRIGVVISAFSYPSVLFYAGLAMGETALLFCFVLIIYSLVSQIGKKKPKYFLSILLGLGLGLAPYAHSRGVVFWVAILPIMLIALRAKWLTSKATALAFSSAILVLAVFASLKAWLIANFYSEVRYGTDSAAGFVTERLSLFEPERLIVLIRVAFGQFSYLITSSFGLLFAGIVAIGTVFWPIFSGMRNENSNIDLGRKRQSVAAALVGLSFAVMFIVSVIQMGTPVRADHFFYGRYNEVLMPPLLIASLLFFLKLESDQWARRAMWLVASLILAVSQMFLINEYPADIFNLRMIWNPLSSWFVHIQGEWKIQPLLIAKGSFIGGLLLIVALVFSRRLFLLVVFAMFLSVTIHNYSIQHRGGDSAWGWYTNFGKIYGQFLSGKNIEIVGDAIMRNISGEALQFAMPDTKVVFDSKISDQREAIFDLTGKSCSKENFVANLTKGSLCVLDSELRSKILKSTQPTTAFLTSNITSPARISIQNYGAIEIDKTHRVCAYFARFFFTGWSRHCLPHVTVQVESDDLNGNEGRQLGLFITDTSARWVSEMRVDLNRQSFIQNKKIMIKVPIRFNPRMVAGNYLLNAAIVDTKGWDYRSVATVKLKLK